MAEQHIYTLKIDSSVDVKIAEFKRQLNTNEEIVNISIGDGHIIILTKESKNRQKNLLVEELVKKSGQEKN